VVLDTDVGLNNKGSHVPAKTEQKKQAKDWRCYRDDGRDKMDEMDKRDERVKTKVMANGR